MPLENKTRENHWLNGKIAKKYAEGIIRSTCSQHVSHEKIREYFEKLKKEEFTTEELVEIGKALIYDKDKKKKHNDNSLSNPESKMRDPKIKSSEKFSSWHYDMNGKKAIKAAGIVPEETEELDPLAQDAVKLEEVVIKEIVDETERDD